MADKRKPLILTLDPVEPSPPNEAAGLSAPEPSIFRTDWKPEARVERRTEPAPEPQTEPPLPAVAAAEASLVAAVSSRRRRREEAAALAAAAQAAPPTPAAKPIKAAKPPKPRPEPRPRRVKPERPARPARPAEAEAGPRLARWAYPTAVVAAVLWAGCMVTFAVGYERGAAAFDFAPLRWTVTGLLALLPAALMITFGYMVRQSARLAEESRRAQALAEVLSGPAALAGAHAQGAVGVMREEIARAQAAADEVARRMSALGDSLAEETRRVSEAAVQAERAASRLGGRLQSERAELASLSGALDAQLASASEGTARHARLAAEAGDLAQTSLHEAQASLAARTSELMTAAGEAARASEAAGGELAAGSDRLERLADGLRREQAEWAAVAQGLLSDQEDMAAHLETERARFGDAAAEARIAADALHGAAEERTGALQRLAGETANARETLDAAARDHAAETAGRLAAAQAALEAEHRTSLESIARAADTAQAEASASASRVASEASAAAARVASEAEAVAESARRRVEALAEAAFAAGQRADQAFDARLAAARRALESQAALIDEAGARSVARIEGGLELMRAAVRQAETPRTADPALAPAPAPTERIAPSWTAPAAVGASEPGSEALAHEQSRVEPASSRPAAIVVPLAPPAAPAAGPALRPRLQLAAVDEELFAPAPREAATVASSAAGAEGDGDDWNWKDLLTAIDDPQPLDDDALAERMIGEIEAMGVDPGALLPRARIDEIARAVDAGDDGRAREAVRRLAPAAVRRLSRRVLTDKVLRGQADLYRARYGDLVRDERRRHGGGGDGAVSALLGSDPGRAFLLLDAAVGDLQH